MSDELDDVKALIDITPTSPVLVALLEQAIRLCDAKGDVPAAYEFRQQYIGEALDNGMSEKALVAFGWNLGQFDRAPEDYDEYTLLWKYKWMIGRLTSFPEITTAQIEASLADFTARCERYGLTRRASLGLRTGMLRELGDLEGLPQAMAEWRKIPRDAMADCAACERNNMARNQYALGHNRRALQTAKPILSGAMSCSYVPEITYADALVPLLRLDRGEEAANYHTIGYPSVEGNPKFLNSASDHIDYRILVGDTAGAIKAFERHIPMAFVTADTRAKYGWYRSALFLFRRLLDAGKATRKLKLPEAFPLSKPKGPYDVAELAGWFETEARALADRFDARAGNRFRNAELDDLNELANLAQTLR
jgi:hypothetical protein